MAGFFTAASAQYLVNAAPAVIDYPFTVGMWVKLTAVGASDRTLFALSDTGTTNNYLLVRMLATEVLSIVGRAGGTENVSSTAIALTAGRWVCVVARFISSTNRRMDIFWGNQGSASYITHNQSTTARAPTGMDTMTLGSLSTSGGVTEPWDGSIGEYWLANVDVQPDGAALSNPTMLNLALGGPFSIPQIAGNIVEYRSLRADPVNGEARDLYIGAGKPMQNWANTNGVTIGPHVPLPYWNINPEQTKTMLPI